MDLNYNVSSYLNYNVSSYYLLFLDCNIKKSMYSLIFGNNEIS